MIDYSITASTEYHAYISALSKLAYEWVPDIRKQFAAKAYEMYSNETVRRIVLAYGAELDNLNRSRSCDFAYAAEHPDQNFSLEDSSMNHAKGYAETLMLLFNIEM